MKKIFLLFLVLMNAFCQIANATKPSEGGGTPLSVVHARSNNLVDGNRHNDVLLTTITTQPASSTPICAGESATLSVIATGTGLTYQWRKNGTPIMSANSSTYIVTSMPSDGASASIYTVVVSSTVDPSVTSDPAFVIVDALPSITVGTVAAICAGSTSFVIPYTATNNAPTTYSLSGMGVTTVTDAALTASSITVTLSSAAVFGTNPSYILTVKNANGCTSSNVTGSVMINALPTITLDAVPAICVGSTTFSLPYTSTTNTPTTYSISGTGITSVTDAAFPIASISGTLSSAAVFGTNPPYTLTLKNANGCTSSNVTGNVAVNPIATVNAVTNKVFCHNEATSAIVLSSPTMGGTIVYNWTNDKPSIGLAASGMGDIAFTATNTGTTPVIATITVTPSYTNGGKTCIGTPSMFTITVNPTATVTPISNQVICNGAMTTAVTFGSPTTGGTIVYNWINSNPSIGTGLMATGSGNFPSFAAVNTGTAPVLATITVTPTYTNDGKMCVGTPLMFTITVNPTVTVNSTSNEVVCADEATTPVSFSSLTTGGTIVYNWTNDASSVGLAASGMGNIALFPAANTGTAPIVAKITVTPSYTNGGATCAGTPSIFTITVNPTATVTAVPNKVICNGAATGAVTFGSPTTGGTIVYNWANDKPSIGLGASGMGNIASFTAINTGTIPVTATITVTPSYTNAGETCIGTPVMFTITVNPTAIVTPISNQVICNGAMTTAVTFGSPTMGGTIVYNWTNDKPSISLAASGTGSIASFMATNTGTTPVIATITVTPSYTNGGETCIGTPLMFTITVNPTATATPISNQVICNGAMTTAVTFGSPTTGGTIVYNWTNSNPSIGTGLMASGSGNFPSFVGVNTGTTPVLATITVTPTYTNDGKMCVGTSLMFTITVNPTATVTNIPNQAICNGSGTTAVTFGSPTTGGTIVYNWTNSSPTIGLPASGTGDIAAFTATNSGVTPITATITVTPFYTNGGVNCTGTASTFTIIVNALPTITVQPTASMTICAGSGTVNLSVGATGTGLTYQWKKNDVAISGATMATYAVTSTTTDAASTSTYTVVVGGTCAPSVTSANAVVVINALPSITVQPVASTTLCAGLGKVLSVTATGTDLIYQWKKDGIGIINATSATYAVTSATADAESTSTYSVVVSGTCSPILTSTNAVVIINALPKITVEPAAITMICAGSRTINLNVGAIGTGLTYQWQKNDVAIPGATMATYAVTSNTTDGASNSIYDVVVSGTCAPTLNSGDAEVIINALPKITLQPTASTTLCAGSRTVNLSVTATGTGLTYQWQKDDVDIPGATMPTYSVTSNTTDGASNSIYDVLVSGTCAPAIFSDDAEVVINALPKITAHPVATSTICAGSPKTLSVTATGTGLTYQWQKGGVNINGATAATYAVPSTTADAASTATYMVVVGGTCTPAVTSTDAIVVINALPKITAQPVTSTTLCAGLGTTLNVTASGTGLTYQWQKNGTAITGETSPSFVISSTTADAASNALYTVVVGGTCTPSVTSANSTVVINALPKITAQPVLSTTLCAGTSTTLSVTATGSGLTYQWKKDGADITGATAATYAIATATTDIASKAVYSVMIGGVCAPSVTSATATVVVNALPIITAQPTASTIICAGSRTITLSVGATGTGVTYQWRKGGVDIGGATAATYDITSTTNEPASTSIYTVVVSGTCTPALTSSNAVVTINALLNVISRPSALTTVCVGTKATLNVDATGTGLIYQWKKDSVDITGATMSTYTVDITTAANAGVYSVVIGSTCSPNDTSANAVLVIDPKPSEIMGVSSINSTFSTTLTNAVSGGTWSSSDTLIAKVDPVTGVVTGVLFGNVTISYTISNTCGVITVKKDLMIIRNTVLVNMKVFLQGPYNPNNGFMDATLRVNGYLPPVEPYSGMNNFIHKGSGGGELFDNPAVTTIIGNNAIVDWVFIELRDKADPTKVVATRSALLQRDGDVVDTDGTSALTLYDVIVGNYYIAIRHRNHLGFRTATAKSLTTNALTLNFTDGSTDLFGTNPLKLIGAAYTMFAGNGDSNGAINAIDKNGIWLKANGQFNYLRADFNMDGAVNAVDRNQYWLLNNSKVQQLD